MKKKIIEDFSFDNPFDAYETKLKRGVWFISYFLYYKLQVNDKCFQYIVNLYFILIFYHGFFSSLVFLIF